MVVENTARPVLLDCDPGIDDALAICDLLARRAAGEVTIAGLIVTAGNLDRDNEMRNAAGWLALGEDVDRTHGREQHGAIPVYPGAGGPIARRLITTPETHGPRGAGYAVLPQRTPQGASPSDGVEAWIELSHKYEGDLHAIVTGPASTLAQALRRDPDIPRRLASLTVMGGTFFGYPGNTTAVAEWNCHVDPEAAREVQTACAQAGVPVRWCGQNVTDFAQIRPAQITDLLTATRGAAVTRALAAALRFYCEFHAAMGEGYLAKVHDPAVLAIALEPQLGRWVPAMVDVACDDPATRGMTVAEVRSERWDGPPNALVLAEVMAPGGAAGLIERWAARHARWVRGTNV